MQNLPLISEAVRGEGGQLKHPPHVGAPASCPSMTPREELAPRDIVARAIDFEMKKHGLDCVHLDISHQSPQFLQEHFPNILARCAQLGIDITQEPIPVVPAAHYTCGGRTDRPGRAHRHCRPVRHWRNRLHRPARRQPSGQQLTAGMHGLRPVPLPSTSKVPP